VKIVLDTNVVIDYLANRMPWADDSEKILHMVAQGEADAAITANTVSDLAYLLRKQLDAGSFRTVLMGLLEVVGIVEVNYQNCIGAFDFQMPDYEDALLAHCAKSWGADYIVTRNQKDFIHSPVPAVTPQEFIEKYMP